MDGDQEKSSIETTEVVKTVFQIGEKTGEQIANVLSANPLPSNRFN